jgi:hypothetical protein
MTELVSCKWWDKNTNRCHFLGPYKFERRGKPSVADVFIEEKGKYLVCIPTLRAYISYIENNGKIPVSTLLVQQIPLQLNCSKYQKGDIYTP